MNNLGTFVALAEGGRLFGLDLQLLLDAAITAVNVFILFICISYILYNRYGRCLRKDSKITKRQRTAESDKAEALALKKEYEEKLKAADKEAESILSEARKVAMHNEQKIVDEAKQEAARIIERANAEAELEKQRVADEVKQQIISVAAVMASKFVAKAMDDQENDALIEQTLNEMGENTWLS